MPDLTTDHPAVEAAERAAARWMEDPDFETDLGGTAYMLSAAREHYAADDLRDTPAGRALLAEGWDEALYDTGAWKQLVEFPPNPYRTETPNE